MPCLLVADSAEDMADAILRLLRDSALASRIADAGRALVERDHSWSGSARALEQLWLAAAQDGPGV